MTPPALPLLIESQQLEARLDDSNLLIVDVRGVGDYAEGHIPGAVLLDYAQLIRAAPPAMGLIAGEAQLGMALSAIGLTPESHVIAYDEEGGGRAGRLLFTLDVLGHPCFSLLNGGVGAWRAEGRPLDQQAVIPKTSDYSASFDNPDALATKDYILSRLGQSDFVPLDTRSPGEYAGIDIRAARGGHIPGAINMNWTEAMDPTRQLRFKPDAALRQMLESRGVTPDKEVVVYCQTHHRSAHTYMVLKHLGYQRLRGYPGAWSEWGNSPELPIEVIV